MNKPSMFILLTLLLSSGTLAQVSKAKCKQELVESYGYVSYEEPRVEKLVFCPNVEATCCPAFLQFQMY